MDDEFTPSAQLRLPVQGAVARTPSAAAAFGGAEGVEASFWGLPSWSDDLLDLGKKYGPTIAGTLGTLL